MNRCDCSANIVSLAASVVIVSLAAPDASEIKSQGGIAVLPVDALNDFDNRIMHRTAVQWMRVGDDHAPVAGAGMPQALQLNTIGWYRHFFFGCHTQPTVFNILMMSRPNSFTCQDFSSFIFDRLPIVTGF